MRRENAKADLCQTLTSIPIWPRVHRLHTFCCFIYSCIVNSEVHTFYTRLLGLPGWARGRQCHPKRVWASRDALMEKQIFVLFFSHWVYGMLSVCIRKNMGWETLLIFLHDLMITQCCMYVHNKSSMFGIRNKTWSSGNIKKLVFTPWLLRSDQK